MTFEQTAELIRAELRRCELDLAPAATLAPLLGVCVEELQAAAGRDPDLGICGSAGHPMIWSLPPGPVSSGFEPVPAQGRLVLVLPGSGSNPHLLTISGRDSGLAGSAESEPDGPGGGELSHTVTRLHRMAERWLIPGTARESSTQRCRRLFQLIARTWQATPSVQRLGGQLEIYQAGHGRPIAARFWDGNGPTDQLELVVWIGGDGDRRLVNVHPGGTHSIVNEPEASL